MKNHMKVWTLEDEEFLKKNNHLYTAEELGKILGRTMSSVEFRRMKLGIKANPAVKTRRLRETKSGENNPNWKGIDSCKDSARERARSIFKQLLPCEVCENKKTERHHADGNPHNNTPENIKFLCRKHHMEMDGRLGRLIERNKNYNKGVM